MPRALRWLPLLPLFAALVSCGDEPSGPDGPAQPPIVLVFEGYLSASPEMLAFDSVRGGVVRLLPPGTVVTDPTPSPDGTRIAFVVRDDFEGTADLYLINRDGSGLTQLTFDAPIDEHPTWSPDGGRIAFRSFRTGRDGDIWVMNADGSGAVNITPDPLPGVTDERRPAWSPDGTRIAFASNAGGDVDLWTMAPNGADRRQLTSSPDFDTEPAWSPDGASLVFRRSTAGVGSDLAVISANGGEVRRLDVAGEQRLPVWSPDGGRVVFVQQATLTDRPDLYSVNVDGSDLTPLVTDAVPGGSLNPAFLRLRD